MILASIDIGTNTVLLLVASVTDEGTLEPLAYEQRIPRLGKGVDRERRLQPDSMTRVLGVLGEYREILERFQPEAVAVCGTSAVRDASNREEFSALVKDAGFILEILSGEEEALWTYRGAVSGIPDLTRATVIDIGGGSTEITRGDAHSIDRHASLNIGSVRLTERLFHHDPPSAAEIGEARILIRNELSGLDGFSAADSKLVGVAGTATTLALLAQDARGFDLRAVTNYSMPLRTVQQLFDRFCRMSAAQIIGLSPVLAGRADLITAGSLILLEAMTAFGFADLVVSERGVRYGLVLREWQKRRIS